MTASGWGLRVRMVVTLCFLIALDVVFVRVAVWFLTGFVPAVIGTLLGDPPSGLSGVDVSLPVLVALSIGFLGVQLFYSRRRMDALVDARVVSPDEAPELHARVGRLAHQALVEPPTVAVAEFERPNSLLIGGVGQPTLVVTRGLLDAADGESLDAVLAHEIGHLANGDAWVMTAASFLPMLTEESTARGKRVYANVRGTFTGDSGGIPTVRGLVAAVIIAGMLIAVSRVFWLASFVVFRLFSRYREYAADDAAAELLGNPASVAVALSSLDSGTGLTPRTDMRARDDETKAICFLPHGLGERIGDSTDEDPPWLESTSYRWRSPEPDRWPVEHSDVAPGARSSRMNWSRLDEIEAEYEDQPMWNFDPDEHRAATLEDLLPGSHPPTKRRIERLRSRVHR